MKNSYAYFLAPLIAWVIAQVAKNLINSNGKRSGGPIEKYLRTGGMPSAHSAVVMALAAVIFTREGFSELFAVVVWVAAITIYDALVARRSIGEQGVALLGLLKNSTVKGVPPRVAMGHKPLEALAGALIGIGVGVIVALVTTN